VRFAIVTFGCRVNQADSLCIEEQLLARGGVATCFEQADLVVVNTCSVTATADQGARQTIRRIARENPRAKIVATGCYATRCPDEVAALADVVRVVKNDDKCRPEFLIPADLADLTRPADVDGDGPCGRRIEPGAAGRTGLTIRAQTGCEESCAYCIIPSTRGASRSAPPADLVRDIRRAVDVGFKEIALTGVHLGSYGRDLVPRSSLLELFQMMERVTGDVMFRISSLEPMDCPPAIVRLVAASGRFLPHFHLPLQHASDRMLRAMRRPYTLDEYRAVVDGIRVRLPYAAIGSDLIVGFPGESDADFGSNLAYLPSSPLTHLHVFPYSDRPGTEAAAMSGKMHGSVIRERGLELRAIGGKLARRFHESQIGTVRPGLTLEDGTLVVTDNYLKVRIPPGTPRNTRVMVAIPAAAPPASAPLTSAGPTR
jgi:threonylcarbamoyladenosine tRNA methylthiotransferase MtaB